MYFKGRLFHSALAAPLLFFFFPLSEQKLPQSPDLSSYTIADDSLVIEPVIHTFLGNYERNFYGNSAPSRLDIIWKLNLGSGITVISRKIGTKHWAGAGWTGQPLLISENGKYYLLQGAYDHRLKKISADDGKIIWQYKFDDVVKSTGSFWINTRADSIHKKYIVFQGSRLGVGNYLDSKHIPSFRAISYLTGKELWRLDVKWAKSYSRDTDGSPVILNDTLYMGMENGLFTVMDPDPDKAVVKDSMLQPLILQELPLYGEKDSIKHGANMVTESSAAMLRNHLYIAAGSGHIYGYNLRTKIIDWDFFIGSDIDGSPVVTSDSCIIVTVEKQYIKGHGGVFKLDPSLPPDRCVKWYFPTGSLKYSTWEGGVIGSAGINDRYVHDSLPHLAAFMAIDGNLYVVNHQKISKTKVKGPDNKKVYSRPELVFSARVGPSISTPVLTGDKIIAAGSEAIVLFHYDRFGKVTELARFEAEFEATPIVHDKKIFVASRNGYLYCFGEKDTTVSK